MLVEGDCYSTLPETSGSGGTERGKDYLAEQPTQTSNHGPNNPEV